MNIKAIQTRYKGYLFRSRLEARWAVFFDALGLTWEYEKEGYRLPSGMYLPDFWFPYGEHGSGEEARGWGQWVEIKPVPLSVRENQLLAELVEVTGHRGYAICGRPWPGEHQVSVFQHHHLGRPKRIPLFSGGTILETQWGKGYDFQNQLKGSGWGFSFVGDYSRAPVLKAAFQAARSARFEHGQSGAQLPSRANSIQSNQATLCLDCNCNWVIDGEVCDDCVENDLREEKAIRESMQEEEEVDVIASIHYGLHEKCTCFGLRICEWCCSENSYLAAFSPQLIIKSATYLYQSEPQWVDCMDLTNLTPLQIDLTRTVQ